MDTSLYALLVSLVILAIGLPLNFRAYLRIKETQRGAAGSGTRYSGDSKSKPTRVKSLF